MKTEDIQTSFPKITPQWLAGFFDGEGCVSICDNKSGYITLHVSITQADLLILSLIALKFKDYNDIYERKYPGNRKSVHIISWNGKKALEILEYIKDCVIVKKEVVDLGIEFAYLISEHKGRIKLPPEILIKKQNILQRVSNINQRGKIDEVIQ